MEEIGFKISSFFDGMQETFFQGCMIAVIICGLVLIGFVLFLNIKNVLKENGKNAVLPVILSTVFGCIIMIPVTIAFSTLVNISVKKQIKNVAQEEIKTLQTEIENQQLKKENLEKQNELIKQEITMNALNKQIALLKSSQLSVMQFEKINEVALLKTHISQTKVWNEQIGDTKKGWGWLANFYDDNYLVVNTYDIDAKFGIDFQNIKICKINDDHIKVLGIEPIYIGSPRNIKHNIMKEIRTYDYDGDGNIKNKKIKNDKAAIYLVDKLEAEKDEEYQDSLADMENWSFLNEAIVSSGENFIKVIFAPAYATIEFVEEAEPGEEFVPLNQYLENEINNGERLAKEIEKALDVGRNAESSL